MGEHVTYYCDLCDLDETQARIYPLSKDTKEFFKKNGTFVEMALRHLCESCMEEINNDSVKQLVVKGKEIVFKDDPDE